MVLVSACYDNAKINFYNVIYTRILPTRRQRDVGLNVCESMKNKIKREFDFLYENRI